MSAGSVGRHAAEAPTTAADRAAADPAPVADDAYARPTDSGAAYDPQPGDRLAPRPGRYPPVPWSMAATFGAPPGASGGFDPQPGARLDPSPPAPSPWWKLGAQHDPWRDPSSPYWLGSGAVFTAGQPAQRDAADDSTDEAVAGPDPAQPREPAARSGRLGLRVVTLGVLVALLAGLVGGYGGYWLAGNTREALHRSDVSLSHVQGAANRPPGSVASIARAVGPAVVSIAVSSADGSQAGVGSGVVIDGHGYVLTNNHVAAIAKDGGTLVVTFSNEDTARAQIVGLDPISDLAVLKVPDDQLTVATLGDSASLAVGDPVIAIGSPLGLEGTVTSGIVSALNRPVHVFNDDGSPYTYLDAIQTDAAINPGNSGGALVDARGAVIGINSASRQLTGGGNGTPIPISGIGYAIPIDYARDIAQQLIAGGRAAHGSLGAQGRTVSAGLQQGAYLEQVQPGGAAARAGLRNGDVIVVADGRTIQSYDQLAVTVQEHAPGDSVSVTYVRGGTTQTIDVVLGTA